MAFVLPSQVLRGSSFITSPTANDGSLGPITAAMENFDTATSVSSLTISTTNTYQILKYEFLGNPALLVAGDTIRLFKSTAFAAAGTSVVVHAYTSQNVVSATAPVSVATPGVIGWITITLTAGLIGQLVQWPTALGNGFAFRWTIEGGTPGTSRSFSYSEADADLTLGGSIQTVTAAMNASATVSGSLVSAIQSAGFAIVASVALAFAPVHFVSTPVTPGMNASASLSAGIGVIFPTSAAMNGSATVALSVRNLVGVITAQTGSATVFCSPAYLLAISAAHLGSATLFFAANSVEGISAAINGTAILTENVTVVTAAPQIQTVTAALFASGVLVANQIRITPSTFALAASGVLTGNMNPFVAIFPSLTASATLFCQPAYLETITANLLGSATLTVGLGAARATNFSLLVQATLAANVGNIQRTTAALLGSGLLSTTVNTLAGGIQIDGQSSLVLTIPAEAVILVSDGSAWWIL